MFANAIRFGGQSLAAPARPLARFSRSFLARAVLSTAALLVAGLGQAQAATTTVELRGEVQVLVEDHAHASRLRYFLKSGKSLQEFRPSRAQENSLRTGARVRLRGERQGELLALDGTTSSLTTEASAPLANTFGNRTMAVLLVNFLDNPVQPFTVATGNAVLGQVNTFIRENSQGQASVSGATFGGLALPIASSCTLATISTAARQAAALAGIDLGSYQHIAYVFPRNSACSWTGLAAVGGKEMLINGSLDARVLGHEYGHNLGLYHSHGLECGSASTVGTCTKIEYGDYSDIMGSLSAAGHLNAFQKERLGWLNYGSMPAITTVTASGTYSLGAFESTATGAKALKILKSTDATTGARTWYYVESRQALGADAFLATQTGSNYTTGLVVRIATEGVGNSSHLLDMTPASSSIYDWSDSALVVGRSYTDATAGVTITPVVVGSTGATINVSLSGTTSGGSTTGSTGSTGGSTTSGGTTGSSGSTTTTVAPSGYSVSAATDKSVYSSNQTVIMSSVVKNGTAAVAGASVTFRLTGADGGVVLQNATTGSNGVASASYRLPRKAAKGSYQLRTSVSGQTATGSVSFSVL